MCFLLLPRLHGDFWWHLSMFTSLYNVLKLHFPSKGQSLQSNSRLRAHPPTVRRPSPSCRFHLFFHVPRSKRLYETDLQNTDYRRTRREKKNKANGFLRRQQLTALAKQKRKKKHGFKRILLFFLGFRFFRKGLSSNRGGTYFFRCMKYSMTNWQVQFLHSNRTMFYIFSTKQNCLFYRSRGLFEGAEHRYILD